MQEMILLKVGELALKGLNRSTFEAVLIKNIRRRLKPLGEFSIQNAQSTLYVTPKSEDIDLNEAVEQLSRVFGIAALNKARVTEKKDGRDFRGSARLSGGHPSLCAYL